MNWSQLFSSSIGKKIVMALTGIFLVVFLVVHCYVNANVFFANGEENFNRAAHFMGTNLLIRITEVGLFAGFILHIVQGYKLELQNRSKRKSRYAVTAGNKTSKWYSRYGPRFVFMEIYKLCPAQCTPDVIEYLIKLGAIMPKFWIEQVFKDQGLEPHRLPDGAMEAIMANGFRLYDEDLHLSVPFVDTDILEDRQGIIVKLLLASFSLNSMKSDIHPYP